MPPPLSLQGERERRVDHQRREIALLISPYLTGLRAHFSSRAISSIRAKTAAHTCLHSNRVTLTEEKKNNSSSNSSRLNRTAQQEREHARRLSRADWTRHISLSLAVCVPCWFFFLVRCSSKHTHTYPSLTHPHAPNWTLCVSWCLTKACVCVYWSNAYQCWRRDCVTGNRDRREKWKHHQYAWHTDGQTIDWTQLDRCCCCCCLIIKKKKKKRKRKYHKSG